MTKKKVTAECRKKLIDRKKKEDRESIFIAIAVISFLIAILVFCIFSSLLTGQEEVPTGVWKHFIWVSIVAYICFEIFFINDKDSKGMSLYDFIMYNVGALIIVPLLTFGLFGWGVLIYMFGMGIVLAVGNAVLVVGRHLVRQWCWYLLVIGVALLKYSLWYHFIREEKKGRR